MASYLVTGANRGLGWAFLEEISADPNNIVLATVRNKAAMEQKVAAELPRSNIHILEAELADYSSLKATVAEADSILGGALDYLILNAGFIPEWSGTEHLDYLAQDPERLTAELLEQFTVHAVAQIHLINLYLPFIQRGNAKKVVAISSGLADRKMTNEIELPINAPYAISKAALNLAMSKFHAQYAKQGILFVSICPGMVETGYGQNVNERQAENVKDLGARFMVHAPDFPGPKQPPQAAQAVLKVIDKASLNNGYGGAFVSHLDSTTKWG